MHIDHLDLIGGMSFYPCIMLSHPFLLVHHHHHWCIAMRRTKMMMYRVVCTVLQPLSIGRAVGWDVVVRTTRLRWWIECAMIARGGGLSTLCVCVVEV